MRVVRSAPALAPVWARNFGGALPQWCPCLMPGFGPQASRWWVSVSVTPKGGAPPASKTGPKLDKTAQTRPTAARDCVRRASARFQHAWWPTGRAWCPLGPQRTPLHTSYCLFGPILGRFGRKCVHTVPKPNNSRISGWTA